MAENDAALDRDDVVTLRDMARIADKIVGDPVPVISGPKIKKEALDAIYDQAFNTPVAIPAYPEEASDLCRFIMQASESSGEDLGLRMIAMPFGYIDIIEERATTHEDPVTRGKYLELIRAVAVFFLRRELGGLVGPHGHHD